MCKRRRAGGAGDHIQDRPELLQHLAVDDSGTGNIIGCVAIKTFVLMPVNVKEADSAVKLDVGESIRKKSRRSNAVLQVDAVLAPDIIPDIRPHAINDVSVAHSTAKRIVHVCLPFALLKVHDAARRKETMPRACNCANARHVAISARPIREPDGSKVTVTCRVL
jgi:hypothetical protein